MSADIVFTSTECVVCLEDESTGSHPVLVFQPCRHCCCCASCISKITEAALPCPFCRQRIESVSKDPAMDEQPIEPAIIEDFKENHRDDYRRQFAVPMASNAGFVGKSKLARSVGAAALSELELRRAETAGGERMMNGSKAIMTLTDNNTLVIDYKVGRSKRHETVPYAELDATLADLKEQLAGDFISALDVAIHYHEHYWLLRYHKKPIEEALVDIGASGKRHAK